MEFIRTAEERLTKTPDEVKNFNFGFSNHMVSGEVITSIEDQSVDIAGLVIVVASYSVSEPVAQVRVSGGEAGNVYKVKIRVVTSMGQKLEGAGLVTVMEA